MGAGSGARSQDRSGASACTATAALAAAAAAAAAHAGRGERASQRERDTMRKKARAPSSRLRASERRESLCVISSTGRLRRSSALAFLALCLPPACALEHTARSAHTERASELPAGGGGGGSSSNVGMAGAASVANVSFARSRTQVCAILPLGAPTLLSMDERESESEKERRLAAACLPACLPAACWSVHTISSHKNNNTNTSRSDRSYLVGFRENR